MNMKLLFNECIFLLQCSSGAAVAGRGEGSDTNFVIQKTQRLLYWLFGIFFCHTATPFGIIT